MFLKQLTENPSTRATLIEQISKLIDNEIATKKGLSGLLAKSSYKALRTIKPTIIYDVLDMLLDDFAQVLTPLCAECTTQSAWKSHFKTQAHTLSKALLHVVDTRAEHAHHESLKTLYKSVRGQGLVHVEAAMPKLGAVLAEHVVVS